MAEHTDRREFLKKAGAVAWVVPTLQVVNMASAAAGGDGGTTGSVVVTTTRPPTSTTQAPMCKCEVEVTDVIFDQDEYILFRVAVYLSDGCGGVADNISLSVFWDDQERNDNQPVQASYIVKLPRGIPQGHLLVEVHNNNGDIIASCSTDLIADLP